MVGETRILEEETGHPVPDSSDVFLSPGWVHHVARVVQAARARDKEFGKLASGFSLNLAYLITDVAEKTRKEYGGDRLVIFVGLDKGRIRKLDVSTELPQEKIDFTVTSNYEVAKRIFAGEVNVATSFINKEIKVEPMSRVYRNPRFTAKSIVAGNLMLKIARQVPTVFPG